jgi:hypothetical protein
MAGAEIQRIFAGLPNPADPRYRAAMFTIEHEFDATVITLVDEGQPFLQEDAVVEIYEDCIVIQQHDPLTERPLRLTLSLQQSRDLAAALNLPEGSYRLEPPAKP